jgi:hypothetical protein
MVAMANRSGGAAMTSTATDGQAAVHAFAEHASPLPGEPDGGLRAKDMASRVGRWGFLAHPDLPDEPGPAFLLVALRPAPTMRHYDPEAIDYWVSQAGRGERRSLTRETPMPR